MMPEDPKPEPIAFLALHAVTNGYVLHEHLKSGGVRTTIYASRGALAVALDALDARLVRERKPEPLSERIDGALDEAGKLFGVDAATLKMAAVETISEGFRALFGIGRQGVRVYPAGGPSDPMPGPGFCGRGPASDPA